MKNSNLTVPDLKKTVVHFEGGKLNSDARPPKEKSSPDPPARIAPSTYSSNSVRKYFFNAGNPLVERILGNLQADGNFE